MATHETQKKVQDTCHLQLHVSLKLFHIHLDVQICDKINFGLHVQFLLLQSHIQFDCASKCIKKQPISTTLVYHKSYYNWNKGFTNCFYNHPCHFTRNLVGQCFNLTIIAHNNWFLINQTLLKHSYLWCKMNLHKSC